MAVFKKGKSTFDTIFCMGNISSKKTKRILQTCYNLLKNSGELILETLIINNNNKTGLIPKGRYANMRNVYKIPTIKECEKLLKDNGFKDFSFL